MIGRRTFLASGPLAVAGSFALSSATAAPTARERAERLAGELALAMADLDPSRRNWRYRFDDAGEFCLIICDTGGAI